MTRASSEDAARGEVRTIESLTTAERELLRLLAAGATHQAVSHRLDMPLRTTRRRIAALMKQLGAVSPFQAGAEAARRGWLVVSANQTLDSDRRQIDVSAGPFDEEGRSW